MKRTAIKRRSKSKFAKIQNVLWELCKQITRLKYGNTCYTCGKPGLAGSSWHTGHLIPKATLGAFLKYDLRGLRPQCYHCNINLGGNGAIFYTNMVLREGQDYVDQLFKDRQITVKATDFYLSLIPKYENIFEQLQNPSEESSKGIGLQVPRE